MDQSGQYSHSGWDVFVCLPHVAVILHQSHGGEVPWHYRARHRVSFHVSSGRAFVVRDGEKEPHELTEGQSIIVPCGRRRVLFFAEENTTVLECLTPIGNQEQVDTDDIVFNQPRVQCE